MSAVRVPDTVRAVVIRKASDGKGTLAAFETLPYSDLPDHDVLVKVAYTTLNYKDGMALTGGRIARRYPMVAGIDLAGTVVQSADPGWKPGDQVIINGFGLSETQWGGYSTYQRVKSNWLVALPEPLSMAQAMGIGTAGYTSMLCVMALQEGGLKPGSGPVLVTGAAGGVGSVAVALLAAQGYEVVASTGRQDTHDYLKFLGASQIIDRAQLQGSQPTLDTEQWAAAIDCVGGETLVNVLSKIQYGGSVAACGLTGGSGLSTTVLPFILRGIRLQGVDSVMASLDRRQYAWQRLAKDLPLAKLDRIITHHTFDELLDLAPSILAGRIQGRVVVKVE